MSDAVKTGSNGLQIASPQIESPCLKICTLDETSSLCTGCGRTRSEIARWTSITSAERRAIMAELPRRLK